MTQLWHPLAKLISRFVVHEEGSGDGYLSPKGPRWETCKGARILATLKEEWRALGMGHLSSKELYEGNMDGGLLYGGLQRIF